MEGPHSSINCAVAACSGDSPGRVEGAVGGALAGLAVAQLCGPAVAQLSGGMDRDGGGERRAGKKQDNEDEASLRAGRAGVASEGTTQEAARRGGRRRGGRAGDAETDVDPSPFPSDCPQQRQGLQSAGLPRQAALSSDPSPPRPGRRRQAGSGSRVEPEPGCSRAEPGPGRSRAEPKPGRRPEGPQARKARTTALASSAGPPVQAALGGKGAGEDHSVAAAAPAAAAATTAVSGIEDDDALLEDVRAVYLHVDQGLRKLGMTGAEAGGWGDAGGEEVQSWPSICPGWGPQLGS